MKLNSTLLLGKKYVLLICNCNFVSRLLKVVCLYKGSSKFIQEKTTLFIFSLLHVLPVRVN